MRYILNNEGYIYDVSFGAIIECSLGTCTEYKGKVPNGYSTIEDWHEGEIERLNAWKIVDGNLVFDASRDYKLQVLYEQENNDNSHVTRKELGMASTEEINPYAHLFPSKSSGSGRIVRLEDWHDKVGNLPTEKIELLNWGEDNLDFIELEFIGSNFLPNNAISNTNNGIKYIQNQDKTISIKGTATAKSTLNLAGTDTSIKKILTFKGNYEAYDGEGNSKIIKQFYNLWGLAEGINLEFYYFDGTDRTLVGTYSEGLIQYDEDTHVTQVVLTVDEGTTIDTTIKPMLTIMGFMNPLLPMTKYKGNLFDKDNGIVRDKYIDVNGNFIDGLSLFYQETYIEVEAGTNYTISCANDVIYRIGEYDNNKTFIKRINSSTVAKSWTFKTSDTTKYLKLSCNISDLDSLQLEEGAVATPYKKYNSKDGWYYLDGVSTQETRESRNLFDKDNGVVTDKYIDASGNIIDGLTLFYQETYMKVKPNTNYTISSNNSSRYRIAEYDINKSFVKRDYNLDLNTEWTMTTSNTTEYIRLSCNMSDLDSIQFEEGSVATEYEPYGISLSPDYPSEIMNIYKAGTYDVLIVNKVYTITLLEDLRGLPNGVGDRLWIDAVNNKSSIERKVGTIVLNGSETWVSYPSSTVNGYVYYTGWITDAKAGLYKSICSHFKNYAYAWDEGKAGYYSDHPTLKTKYFVTDKATVDEWKTWLSTHNIEVQYELETYKTEVYPSMEYTSIGEFSWLLDEYSKYEGYKNNTTLIDLAGNEFRTEDKITIEDNQVILIKNGLYGNEFATEEIFLGNVVMPKTYNPITSIYCHQNILIKEVVYRDPRNVDITKISLKGLLSITDIETEYNYTLEDVEKVIAYVNGETTLTDEELEYYDINADGVVDKVDSAEMLRMYYGYISNIVNGTLEINSTKANRTIVLRDSEGKIRTSLGLNGATTPNLSCENLTAKNIQLNNKDLIDTLFFKNGETYQINRMHLGGFITSSAENVTFTIPLPKRLDNISSISVIGGKMFARVADGGYINGGTYDDPISYGDSGYSWDVTFFNENTVTIGVRKSSDYTNVTNNSPLGIEIQDFILQFSDGSEQPEQPEVQPVDNTKTITANGANGYHKFTLNVSEDSIVDTKSLLSFSFKISRIQTYDWNSWGKAITYEVKIGSNTYKGTIPAYDGSSTVTLKSVSNIEIEHNADGTKTIPISFKVTDGANQSYTCGNASASGSITLTKI